MKIRIARATNELIRISKMYCDGLGMEVLGSFEGHSGFDGIMIGSQSSSYHLEFTQQKGFKAPASHSEESLLVFYIPEPSKFQHIEAQMIEAGFTKTKSHNQYWDEHGCTFQDFEGYTIVLCRNDWQL